MGHILEMESGRESETLEGGFLESKLKQNEILCSKFQEDGILGCLSNANEISNVELAGKFGVGGVEESMVDGICGNNRINEVLVNGYPDEKLSISMHNLDFPVFDGELKGSRNYGDQTAKFDDNPCCDDLLRDVKIEAHVKKNDDVFHPHEPGSPTKIEVSGSSINLFVEVFGPLDGISDDNSGHSTECKLEENDFQQELSLEEIGSLSTGVTDLSAIYDEQQCAFDVGDLVWFKTRNQLWWPGMISDPSSAPDDVAKCEKKGYLVKLYGSAHFVWCDNVDLKPFVQYFDQMSGQINSRNFCGSVERAICEIGLRVQLKMTCPCFSKDSQTLGTLWSLRDKGENCMSTGKASKCDVVSLSQFQPAAFIADIRDLARSIRIPSKVVLMVMKNRLSPFYRSMGHFELPLQLIRSGSDAAHNIHEHLKSGVVDENSVEGHDSCLTRTRRKRKIKNHIDGSGHVLGDYITSSAKGVESRERKKSRYLSYPYVDVIKGQEKEDQKQKGTKKSVEDRHIISKEDDINACSAELLSELRSSARDCSYIDRSKYSDTLRIFYCSYRKFSLDIATKAAAAEAQELMERSRAVKKSKKQKMNLAFAKENIENVVGDMSSVAGGQKPKRKYTKKKKQVTNAEDQMEGIQVIKVSENHGVNLASSSLENAHKLPETENPRSKENGVCMETNKEKEKVIPQNYFPNIYPKSSWMISFQQACSNLFKTPHKSVGVAAGIVGANLTPRLPDLNGNHPGYPVDHIPAEGPTINQINPVPEQKNLEGLVSPAINGVHQTKFTPVSSSKGVTWPMTFQNTPLSTNGVTGPYQCVNGDIAVRALDPITGLGSTIQRSFQMGDFLAACKPVAKKRKRKENTGEVASGIPDLNGNVLDTTTSPLGTTAPEGSHIPPPEGETLRKKRNKYDSGESGGGSLVLNFAAGTVPAKETLVAAFSRYGLLKESELEVMSDDSIKIVYERSSDARFAFRSLEKSHTFGESLLNFNLDCCIPEPPKIKKKTNFQLQTFVPVTVAGSKNRTKAVEARPDMAFIKQNVEMMKSTLEKAGDKLPPETRTKLENEIKVFLDKISSATGSGHGHGPGPAL